jgi:hypothetical protein
MCGISDVSCGIPHFICRILAVLRGIAEVLFGTHHSPESIPESYVNFPQIHPPDFINGYAAFHIVLELSSQRLLQYFTETDAVLHRD